MYRSHEETAQERSLRYELESTQEELRKTREDQERQREQNRREWQEQMHEQYRTAESWPEVLRKQAHLFASEATKFPCDDEGRIPGEGYNRETDYFATGADACNRAVILWAEVSQTKQAEIEELQHKLALIQSDIQREVADKLDSESQLSGWKQVAIALREEVDPSAWLNW